VLIGDGRTQELTAPESGLATLQFKDGSEYGFRPTIQDSSPWNRIVVIIFRTATTSAPTTILGEVEVKRGGPLVQSKTTPSFKCPSQECRRLRGTLNRRRLRDDGGVPVEKAPPDRGPRAR
jgi:hypothetical protein